MRVLLSEVDLQRYSLHPPLFRQSLTVLSCAVSQYRPVLGITQGMLYNYVRNGTLKPVVPPGKRQGVYPCKEVDQLAHALQIFGRTALSGGGFIETS